MKDCKWKQRHCNFKHCLQQLAHQTTAVGTPQTLQSTGSCGTVTQSMDSEYVLPQLFKEQSNTPTIQPLLFLCVNLQHYSFTRFCYELRRFT